MPSKFLSRKCQLGSAKILALPLWHQMASVERLAENTDIGALRAQNANLKASLDAKIAALEQEVAWLINQATPNSPLRELLVGEIAQFVGQIQALTGQFP